MEYAMIFGINNRIKLGLSIGDRKLGYPRFCCLYQKSAPVIFGSDYYNREDNNREENNREDTNREGNNKEDNRPYA